MPWTGHRADNWIDIELIWQQYILYSSTGSDLQYPAIANRRSICRHVRL